MKSLFILLCCTFAALSNAQSPVTLNDGDVEFSVNFNASLVGSATNPWMLTVRDEVSFQEFAGMRALFADPERVLLEALEDSRTNVPNDPRYQFLGNVGAPIWILPATPPEGLMALGISTQNKTVLAPSWTSHGVPGNLFLRGIPSGTFSSNRITLQLSGFSGPGHLFMYGTDASANPTLHFNTADGLDFADSRTITAGNHLHFNWAFTTPGEYTLALKAFGTLLSNSTVTESDVTTFRVLVVPEPSALMLLLAAILMINLSRRRCPALAMPILAALCSTGWTQQPPYTHFEGRHTHSLALTPSGERLLALHTSAAQLSVFDISNSANAEPVLIQEIAVGLEPVAVRARTEDEAWVVSEVGDSIAIVSLSLGHVLETLRVPDEPADVVFAQGRAFVSCARNSMIRIFDATTRQEIGTISLDGVMPRALAVNTAGTRVYAAFLLSGNGTTVLRKELAPPPPAPSNPALPPAPQTALIVPVSHPQIDYTVLDRDVVEIDVATLSIVRYLSGVGTNLLDLAVQPSTGDLWVANTEARNLVRFEPALRGHVADHRLTRLAMPGGVVNVWDLNPGIDYSLLPNPSAQTSALAQPTALAFSADGTTLWVAAFGSDRIARVNPSTGSVLTRVELRSNGQGSRQMRGPRSLAIKESTQRLYVLNRLSATLSVLSTATNTLITEIPLGSHDPMPVGVKEGRGFLFDARLSGNGTGSCAVCHLDADLDGLAWDLGDPSGAMQTVMGANLSVHDDTLRPRVMHPMKGPMVTQTLRGLNAMAPFHWRGDRPTIQSFNGTFDQLLGGSQLSPADINALTAYLLTLRNHPNPNLQRNGALPATFQGGDPLRGAQLFTKHENHCGICHALPAGTDLNIDLPQEVGSTQPLKNPTLRTVYQRALLNPQPGQISRSGFGLNHDGTGFALPTVHPYVLDELTTPADFADVRAFVLCFDTGSAPAIGDSRTVTSTTIGAATGDIARLESQTMNDACDLVVRGTIAGLRRSFRYSRVTGLYVPDSAAMAPLSRNALLALLGSGDVVTFIGVPPLEGGRFGGDRDGNGIADRDEPSPSLTISPVLGAARLTWAESPAGWSLEFAPAPGGPWSTVTHPRARAAGWLWIEDSFGTVSARFYRLRRTW